MVKWNCDPLIGPLLPNGTGSNPYAQFKPINPNAGIKILAPKPADLYILNGLKFS